MKKKPVRALLVEMLAVTLFFALIVSVLIQVYFAAYGQGRKAERLDDALAEAQTLMAGLHASEDAAALLSEQGYVQTDEVWTSEDGELIVTLSEETTAAGRLVRGEVSAQDGEEALFRLPFARYWPEEVAP